MSYFQYNYMTGVLIPVMRQINDHPMIETSYKARLRQHRPQ